MLPLQIPNIVGDSIPSAHEELALAKSLPLDELIDKLIAGCVTFAINLTIAIIVFYIGKFIIKRVYKFLNTIMHRRQVDKSLTTFVLSMVKIVMSFILIVVVIGILGIETSSFIAIFASAGVAIGMALSGTLQNFAGGVLILLLKPYKVGDYIEVSGYAGYVREIQIFHTIISTYDNKSIIIPNGGLSTGSINNWSREDYRRVEWTVSISYGDDVDVAREVLLKMFDSDERVVKKYVEEDRKKYIEDDLEKKLEIDSDGDGVPDVMQEMEGRSWLYRIWHRRKAKMVKKIEEMRKEQIQGTVLGSHAVDRSPSVTVSTLNNSSVDLVARAWTRTDQYWGLYYDINERIYKELPSYGIHFPFPQMDIHLNRVSD